MGIRSVLAVSFLSLSTPPALAQQGTGQIDLRPKFQQGDQFRYEMRVERSQEVNGSMPIEIENQSVMTLGLRFDVKSVDEDGGAEVLLTIDRVSATTDGDLGEHEWDSVTNPAGDPDNKIVRGLRRLFQAEIPLTFDRDGNITHMVGLDDMLDPRVLATVSQDVRSWNVRNRIGRIFSIAKSDNKASVGETWEHEDVLPPSNLGVFHIRTENKLVSHEDGLAKVEFTGEVHLDAELPHPETGEFNKTGFELRSSDVEGHYVWNTELGRLDNMVFTVDQVSTGAAMGADFVRFDTESTVTITAIQDAVEVTDQEQVSAQ